jgi:hypothetical protein
MARASKPWIKEKEVRRHVPTGRELPARFDDFILAEPPCRVEWNDLDEYALKPSATNEAVPFLRMGEGSIVALWYYDVSPAVVLLGSEGELIVVARSFDDFLKGCALRCSGVPDIDTWETAIQVSGIAGEPNSDGLPELQKRFEEWFKKHTSLLEPLRTPESEVLRQRVFGIAEQMLRDGLSKVYTQEATWWVMDFRIERNRDGLRITYIDYGKWYPVPQKYGMLDEVIALLSLVLNKQRDSYELSVLCVGIVSIDRDRELLLVPPDYEDQ